MRTSTPLALAVALALAAPLASHAAQESELTQQQRQKLEALSPDVRQKVIDRLGPEQTIDGILETMIVNIVSARHPGAEQYVPNVAKMNVDVIFKNERWLVTIDPSTLQIAEERRMETQ